MYQGRQILNLPWHTFQCGHHGWFYTDANSVMRGPFKTEQAARRAAKMAMQKVKT